MQNNLQTFLCPWTYSFSWFFLSLWGYSDSQTQKIFDPMLPEREHYNAALAQWKSQSLPTIGAVKYPTCKHMLLRLLFSTIQLHENVCLRCWELTPVICNEFRTRISFICITPWMPPHHSIATARQSKSQNFAPQLFVWALFPLQYAPCASHSVAKLMINILEHSGCMFFENAWNGTQMWRSGR